MTESAVDRLAVIETCTRVAWHADQREWDALRDVFAGGEFRYGCPLVAASKRHRGERGNK